jgi:hypothetical protein
MKKVEITFLIFFVIGIILKPLLLVGGSTVIGLALNSLAVLYFVATIPIILNIPLKKTFSKSTYKGITHIKIIGLVAMGHIMAILTIGVLFKNTSIARYSINDWHWAFWFICFNNYITLQVFPMWATKILNAQTSANYPCHMNRVLFS